MDRIVKTLTWNKDYLEIIDQTLLPLDEKYIKIKTIEAVWEAIRGLHIRGAPAIGVASAFGLVLAAKKYKGKNKDKFFSIFEDNISYMKTARPTAYNLFYGLARLKKSAYENYRKSIPELQDIIEKEAEKMFDEDMESCKNIGENGSSLIKDNINVLSHCNAGGLATTGFGTSLSVFYFAWDKGRKFRVFVDETRPVLQGARLTTWELKKAGIPHTLICDSTAAFLMQQKKIDIVIVGADRICANGDTANKIGTYNIAVIAAYHKIPFYIAAPLSTFDFSLKSGDQIPIEERPGEEVTDLGCIRITPEETDAYNPAFDVTPAKLIKGFITEKGIFSPKNLFTLKKI
ncbi:MAG: S-methyl-5-thioribose-1-phosphate isomerase [Candidatus Omnitrophica bacterium]|nr:S-methyl-5-thioribose-1-phosphate isomerase [Candidatus Omnitrophota bacterium]